jgi:hypothetical protein
MKHYTRIIMMLGVVLFTLIGTERASAQHTLTLTGGSGLSTARFYPAEMTKWLWGSETFGLSWRFYSDKPRFVGAVGIDLEYIERGYQVGYTYTSKWVGEGDDKHEERTYKFYDRDVNTIMLPLVWQPHVYAARNRLRIFIEAAVVFSFNISSNYEYLLGEYPGGKYEWKVPRDNRFGYGLSGGAGFAVLLGQVEVGFKARYNFGYSDILKNRNKYYSNSTDGRENPFYYTPLRSPMDNINMMLTVGWRFNKRGFDEWFVVRPKREKRLDSFNFSAQTGANQGGGTQSGGQRRSQQHSR